MRLSLPVLIASSVAYNSFSVDAQDGTGKFHVNTATGKCVKDCIVGGPLDALGQCDGIVTESWIHLHSTIDQCCSSSSVSWMKTACIVNSQGGGGALAGGIFTDKFYVFWDDMTCVQDCDPIGGSATCKGNPPPDTGHPPVFFDTAAECCANKVWWKTLAACTGTAATTTITTTTTTIGGTCTVDADCTQVCNLSGTCAAPIVDSSVPCPCTSPKTVPNQCDVDILIDMLEFDASTSRELTARWLRAAFHDAGTFNQGAGEGGANGCLLNDPDMRNEPENFNLDSALNALSFIKDTWIARADTCLDVSSADIIQFAGRFAATRQSGVPGPIDLVKRDFLVNTFKWGRPDEPNCDLTWTLNLPGFMNGGSLGPERCTSSGKEIKEKMMKRNSFTAEEATALIGAHTIGLVRDTFPPGFAGPWVLNGADDFSPDGPVFDNEYFKFGKTIVANTCTAFAANLSPFDRSLGGSWVRQDNTPLPGLGLDWLDTDIAIMMPSEDTDDLTGYPNFHTFSEAFALDNSLFIDRFFKALDKMSKLGVDPAILSSAGTTCGCGNRRLTRVERSLAGVSGVLTTDDMYVLARGVGAAFGKATMTTIAKQFARLEEMKILGTQDGPYNTTGTPTSSPAANATSRRDFLRG